MVFFIAFLGLKNAGIIVPNESTIVALGDLHSGPVLLAVFGIVVTVAYMTIGLERCDFLWNGNNRCCWNVVWTD